MRRPERILWMDVETTGLDPKRAKVLEVALVLTDGDLDEIARYHAVISNDISASIPHRVKEMHIKNGLFNEVLTQGKDAETVRTEIYKFLLDNIGIADLRGTLIGGSSPHFDKAFLRESGLVPIGQFSHRVIDVSTVRSCAALWSASPKWPMNEKHRAMDDILDHIEELKKYKDVFFQDKGS